MNAHFANRRALTLFLAILRGAVPTLSQGLRCRCQSRAEDQATATPVCFGSQSRLFPSVLTRATKDRRKSAGQQDRRTWWRGSDTTRDPLSQKPCFRIAGRRSPPREVTGFQSKCFDSNFRKRSVRLDSFIRRHHGRNDCRGLGRISFGHEKDRANRWAAT
jgi:hypothetical protein